MTDDEIKDQAGKIVNEYIHFWNDGKSARLFKIEHLDALWEYLVFCHNEKHIDIFDYDDSLFYDDS